MSDADHTTTEREELEALLAWYAAGTLSAEEARRVEAALAADPELARSHDLARDELAAVIAANERVGVPSAHPMQQLFAAIEREPRSARAVRTGLWRRLVSAAASLRPRTLAWASAAAVAIIAVQAVVIATGVLRSPAGETQAPASYATASAPAAPPPPGAYALVQFAPTASAAEIARRLQTSHATIVEGPLPGGLYRVRVAAAALPADQRAALAARLQDGKVVIFAAAAE